VRQVYSRSFYVTFATGDSGYVFSDKIESGYVLHVHSCFAYAPEREANDDIIVGIRDGGLDMIMQAQATAATQRGSAVDRDFFVGEGDQVFAYFPDADNGDSLSIHINGVLTLLKDWDKMAE